MEPRSILARFCCVLALLVGLAPTGWCQEASGSTTPSASASPAASSPVTASASVTPPQALVVAPAVAPLRSRKSHSLFTGSRRPDWLRRMDTNEDGSVNFGDLLGSGRRNEAVQAHLAAQGPQAAHNPAFHDQFMDTAEAGIRPRTIRERGFPLINFGSEVRLRVQGKGALVQRSWQF